MLILFYAQVIKLAEKWKFKYVENMAWVQQGVNNRLTRRSYRYFQKSKLSLLILRLVPRNSQTYISYYKILFIEKKGRCSCDTSVALMWTSTSFRREGRSQTMPTSLSKLSCRTPILMQPLAKGLCWNYGTLQS